MKKQLLYLVTVLTIFGVPLYAEWHGNTKSESELRKQEEEALLEAVKKGHFHQVVTLYHESLRREKFKKLDLKNSIGNSVVCLAAYFGDSAVVEYLLDHGQSVNGHDRNGNTPLIWAAYLGNNELVTLLLARGADPTIKNKSGLTALQSAYQSGSARVAFSIVEKLMEQDTTIGWKALPWCVVKGGEHLKYPLDKNLMRLLISGPLSPVTIDETNSNGDTALMLAVKENKRDTIKLLLSKGASATQVNKESKTPLSVALDRADDELVYLFAKQAAQKDEKNKVKYGSLTWAARYNLISIVRILLKRNSCVVDARDTEENTPLLWAVTEGHEVVARMLLQAGADVQVKNKYGISPLYMAAQKGDAEMLALLNRNANILDDTDEYGWNALITAARYGHLDTVKTIISVQKEDTDRFINMEDTNGNTALHWAARFGHLEIVKVLLEHGADVTKENKYERTPLYWAVRNKYAKIVRLLLDKKAYDNKVDARLFIAYCKATNTIKNLFV